MKIQRILIYVLLLEIFSTRVSVAQDTLMFRNGLQQIGKVVEISLKEVKYKKAENIEGPTYLEQKNDILMIKYKNGTSEKFEYTKPWLTSKPEENIESKPLVIKKYPEMKKLGSRFLYADKILTETEMQDVLMDLNYPQITNHIKLAKQQRGWQHIGFAAFPCGLASLYFLSETSGGLFSNYNTPPNKQYENNAKFFALLGVACITTSITLKAKRNKNNAAALKLYKQNF